MTVWPTSWMSAIQCADRPRAEVWTTISPQLKQYSRDVQGELRPITRDLYQLLLAMAGGTVVDGDEAALLARATS
ncbi:MAG TPA: hypothetical protein VD978_01390 [Azospirillum sp.]|nr:hypothetical protein [Azospirillum sp.]